MANETTRRSGWLLGCAVGALALSCGGGQADGGSRRLRRPRRPATPCGVTLSSPTGPRLDAVPAWRFWPRRRWSSRTPGPAPPPRCPHSSLFTRRTPDELGVTAGNRMLLGPEVVTLTERLSEAGFETAAFVSARCRRFPTPIGDVALAQGFEHYDDRMAAKERNRRLLERNAPDTVRAALDWLDAGGSAAPLVPLAPLHRAPVGGTPLEPLELAGTRPLARSPWGRPIGARGDPALPGPRRRAGGGLPRRLSRRGGALPGTRPSGTSSGGSARAGTWIARPSSCRRTTASPGASATGWFTHGQSLAPELVRVP